MPQCACRRFGTLSWRVRVTLWYYPVWQEPPAMAAGLKVVDTNQEG
jgi:hypothetical protein